MSWRQFGGPRLPGNSAHTDDLRNPTSFGDSLEICKKTMTSTC